MVEVESYLNLVRLIIGVIILLYASYTDIKTRRAANILWIILGVAGGIFLVIQYFMVGFTNPLILIFIPIMIGLMYLLFQLGLIFGGADAKALMALAILVPVQPVIFQSYPLYWSYMPAPWVVFTNSLIIFMFLPLSLFGYNLLHKTAKIPHSFIGYKMSIEKAKETFVWPMEKLVNGKRKIVKLPKSFDVDEEIQRFEDEGYTDIWVTPKVPFMIPLLIGFILTFLLGDLLSLLINGAVSLLFG